MQVCVKSVSRCSDFVYEFHFFVFCRLQCVVYFSFDNKMIEWLSSYSNQYTFIQEALNIRLQVYIEDILNSLNYFNDLYECLHITGFRMYLFYVFITTTVTSRNCFRLE